MRDQGRAGGHGPAWGLRAWARMVACCVALSPAALPEALASPPDARFDVSSTIAVAGRTRVIAFHAPALQHARALPASVSVPGVIELVEKPLVVSGSEVGYLRVRGLQPGRTVLQVADARLTVEVVEEPRERGHATVVSPADGAVVWGEF